INAIIEIHHALSLVFQVIYELPTANQWCFDVQWCPRNPALLSAASFDGRISVYSVMGGRLQQQQHSTVDQISASFDSSDPFGTGQTLPPLQVPQPSVETTIVPPLKKPPKWVRRPVGASFAVNFEDEARVKFLRLLGFSKDELQRKISACLGRSHHPNGLDVNDLAEKMQTLSDQRAEESGGAADGLSGRESPADFFSQLPKKEKDRAPFQIPVSSGFPPSQPFAQSGSLGAPVGFMSGPSMSGPSVPPSSPPGPMMPAPPAPGFLSPTSLPGGPVPLFPVAAPGGAYLPLGAGYPQGGPGAPGAKSFSGAGVPPPPTGYFPWLVCHTEEEENYTPPAPITAPVMGFPAEAPVPQDRIQVPPGAPQEPSKQSLQQLPAEHVGQKEIPAEHMILKTTFSSLVQRCQLAAADPVQICPQRQGHVYKVQSVALKFAKVCQQTKRKLDDASKRLESLYDKLRDQALSPSILGGLHEISRCVSARNYQQGLEVHTQVVSSSNFSEISAFMPVLKVLMTIANKLAV
ncbi:hypothetical protein cypCar_00040462, partial [Cyprinus carpio]